MPSDSSSLTLLEDHYTSTRSCLQEAIEAAERSLDDEGAMLSLSDPKSLRLVEAALEYYLLGLFELVFQAIALIAAEHDIRRFTRREAISSLSRRFQPALRNLDKRRNNLLHLRMYPVEEACMMEPVAEAVEGSLSVLEEAIPDLLDRAPAGQSLEDLEIAYSVWKERLDHASILLRESGTDRAVDEIEGALKYSMTRFFEVLFKTAAILPENQEEEEYWAVHLSRFDIIERLQRWRRTSRRNARALQELLVERNIMIHFRASWETPYRYHKLPEALNLVLEYAPVVDGLIRALHEDLGAPNN